MTPFEEIKLRALNVRLYHITHRMNPEKGYFFVTPDEVRAIYATIKIEPIEHPRFYGLQLYVIEGWNV
jgi:hypothetical protein